MIVPANPAKYIFAQAQAAVNNRIANLQIKQVKESGIATDNTETQKRTISIQRPCVLSNTIFTKQRLIFTGILN